MGCAAKWGAQAVAGGSQRVLGGPQRGIGWDPVDPAQCHVESLQLDGRGRPQGGGCELSALLSHLRAPTICHRNSLSLLPETISRRETPFLLAGEGVVAAARVSSVTSFVVTRLTHSVLA